MTKRLLYPALAIASLGHAVLLEVKEQLAQRISDLDFQNLLREFDFRIAD
jgi:hypothetical protein